ncbi:MAG: hypothetical protein WAU58_00410 [Terriglobales bacterium]
MNMQPSKDLSGNGKCTPSKPVHGIAQLARAEYSAVTWSPGTVWEMIFAMMPSPHPTSSNVEARRKHFFEPLSQYSETAFVDQLPVHSGSQL